MAKGRSLTAEESALWRRAMRHTEPLSDRPSESPNPDPKPVAAAASEPPASRPLSRPSPEQPAPKKPDPKPTQEKRLHGLDSATARKARRGKLSVEGRIDLHGMRQDEAHGALIRFVMSSVTRGRRCVLVITGKGGRERDDGDALFMSRQGTGDGVLRRMLPVWLAQEPLRSRVYACEAAHSRDGGSGAFYVFLKRARSSA